MHYRYRHTFHFAFQTGWKLYRDCINNASLKSHVLLFSYKAKIIHIHNTVQYGQDRYVQPSCSKQTKQKYLIKILSVKAALPALFCYFYVLPFAFCYSKKLNNIYSKHKSASFLRFFRLFKCKMLMSKYYVVVHCTVHVIYVFQKGNICNHFFACFQ